ncbi:hypothetical protein HG536_0B01550 [Torulaspora globosa]|uniref:ubiquitinyl hydrolase 1 n=1 Tax=Torulaspora globosa TaxID=48254 RepID=A0A7G3ZCQ6_9SACH|nr:uncharacterized protein HG536_0B01550 [Torulaspora globosa]QLL31292.1 hypothetical protein HG536_0B01550 [Torulaspora globosa]
MISDDKTCQTIEASEDAMLDASSKDGGKAVERAEEAGRRDESPDILTLESQREIISKILKDHSELAREGDEMCIIPQLWYDKFLDEEISDSTELGPMDTSSICRDYKNFILEDYERRPYLSIPRSAFEKLVEWYGLTARSQPVTTVLVHDSEAGGLVTEYNKCILKIHYLVLSSEERRYANEHPIYITTSRLSTVGDVLEEIYQAFYRKESHLGVDNKTKVWYVKDSSTDNRDSVLSLTYKLNPLQFMELPVKTLVTSQLEKYTLKKLEITSGDFVVEVKQRGQNYHWLSNYFIYNKLKPSEGTIGLSNLGNSCYMNSALQCLMHIPELRDYFLYNGYESEINIENPLGYQGHIAKAFSMLVQALFMDSIVPRNTAFSPTSFKSTIGHFNSMFFGYMQQDSQEFLAFILDGLHEDLNRIRDKPYLEKPSLTPEMDADDPKTVKKLADDTWKMHLLRNDSIVTDLFVGLYKSTLECPQCETVSITFDPYNDLTLPLPVNATCCLNIKVFPQNSPPCIIKIEISKTASYQQLKTYVGEYAKIEPSNLYGCEIFNHQFCSNYESPETMSHFLPVQELISDPEDVIFYELVASPTDIIVPVLNTRIEEGFETASLFGVPFFIVLSSDEAKNPGLIRLKLEKYYTNLSGGFVEFPLSTMNEVPSIESRPLLQQKYNRDELCAHEEIFRYSATDTANLDGYFSIKVLQSSKLKPFARVPSTESDSQFYIPTSRLNLKEASNINELLDPIVRDIYDYSNFEKRFTSCGESENHLEQTNNHYSSEAACEDQIGSDIEIDSVGAAEDMGKSREGEEDEMNRKPDAEINAIIQPRDIILCEWTTSGIEEAFAQDKDIDWEHPAELVNKEITRGSTQEGKTKKENITLYDCLKLFSKKEVLSMDDSWYCPTCKEHRQASKQIQLWNTPDILLIHLKRFENQRSFSDKIDDVVHFPIEGLDMGEYIVESDSKGSIYDLIAVDNHYGGIGGGHYTAYVKQNDKWYYFDDSRVTETDPQHSIAGSAYLLFYLRRTGNGKVGGEKLQAVLNESRREHDLKMQKMQEQQYALYVTNKTDEEEETDDESNASDDSNDDHLSDACCNAQPSINNSARGFVSRPSQRSIASLEVGSANRELAEGLENNLGRRKLRKTHTAPSTSNSPASSVSSDGAESISAVLTGSKINDGVIAQSPAKE